MKGPFNPDVEDHHQLAEEVAAVLQDFDELPTGKLAETLQKQGRTPSEWSTSYLRSLLTSGSGYITSKTPVSIRKDAGNTGGEKTFHWRLEK